MWGLLRALIWGWLKRREREGPPGRGSVSREWEAQRLLLMKALTLPNYSKGENSRLWDFKLMWGLERINTGKSNSPSPPKNSLSSRGGREEVVQIKSWIILFTENPKHKSKIQYELLTPNFYFRCKIQTNKPRKPTPEFYSYIYLNLSTITKRVNYISRNALI